MYIKYIYIYITHNTHLFIWSFIYYNLFNYTPSNKSFLRSIICTVILVGHWFGFLPVDNFLSELQFENSLP